MKLLPFLQDPTAESNRLISLSLLLLALVLMSVLFPSLSGIFYALTGGLFVFSGVSIWRQLPHKKLFIFLFLVGAGIFWASKAAILTTEFWGDEIGVLHIAQKPFSTIAELAMSRHIVVPPLDYQNLHWWLVLTQNVPAAEQEFYWRVPYMVMHVMAAIFFASIVTTHLALSKKENVVYSLLIFLLYVTHPLFFVYGFEIRFYAFSILSLMLVYYGFITRQTSSAWWVCITILSSLNSTTFPISITLFSGTVLLMPSERSKRLFFWLTLFITQLIILAVYSQTLSLPETNTLFRWQLFAITADQFVRTSLPHVALLPIVIVAWALQKKQLLKEFSTHNFVMLASALGFIATIFISFLLMPHPDIGMRHFILGIPAILIFFYRTILVAHKKLAIFCIASILLVQLLLLNQSFKQHWLVGKDYLNSKNAFEIAAAQKSTVVFLMPDELHSDLQGFFELSLKWYSQRHQVTYQFLTLQPETCQEILANLNEAVFIKGQLLEIPCVPLKPIQLLEYLDH